MTDGTQGCAAERGWAAAASPGACPSPAPGTLGDPMGLSRVLGAVSRRAAAEVPARQRADTINQQLAKWGS